MNLKPIRVLVIPGKGENLDLALEATLLANLNQNHPNLQIEILPVADATELQLMRKLAVNHEHYQGLHFFGHATADSFTLASGDQLFAESIHQLTRDAGAFFVFLNGCSTAQIGQYLVNYQLALALAYTREVFDQDAILLATRFYISLARAEGTLQQNLRHAYLAVMPPDGSFFWLVDGVYTRSIFQPIINRIDLLEDKYENAFAEFKTHTASVDTALNAITVRFSDELADLDKSRRAFVTALFVIITLVLLLVLTSLARLAGYL